MRTCRPFARLVFKLRQRFPRLYLPEIAQAVHDSHNGSHADLRPRIAARWPQKLGPLTADSLREEVRRYIEIGAPLNGQTFYSWLQGGGRPPKISRKPRRPLHKLSKRDIKNLGPTWRYIPAQFAERVMLRVLLSPERDLDTCLDQATEATLTPELATENPELSADMTKWVHHGVSTEGAQNTGSTPKSHVKAGTEIEVKSQELDGEYDIPASLARLLDSESADSIQE